MRSGWGTIAAVASVVLLLAACADPDAVGPSAEPGPTPSPSPTVEVPVSVRPEAQVPLTCDEVGLPAGVGAFFGRELVTQPIRWSALDVASEEQGGRFGCTWLAGDRLGSDYISSYVSITRDAARRVALDAAAVALEDAPPPFNRCRVDEFAYFQCGYAKVVGDYLIRSNTFGHGSGDAAAMQSMVAASLESAEASLRDRPVPVAWAPEESALPIVVDCVALLGQVPVADVMGDPGVQLRDVSGAGEDYLLPREIAAIGGRSDCEWTPSSVTEQNITVHLLSSGAWYWDAIEAPDGRIRQPIEIEGADHAAISCVMESCIIEATVGVDALQVVGGALYAEYSGTTDQLVEIATAIVAELAAD